MWVIIPTDEKIRAAVSWYKRKIITDAYSILDYEYLREITSLDLSGCVIIDGGSVAECVAAMPNLEFFIYRNCKYVNQYNHLKIAEQCRSISYIDGTSAGTVSYSIALCVLCTLPKLGKIAVMPKDGEASHWAKLVAQFSNVCFAQCIKNTIPYEGNISTYKRALKACEM